MFQEHAMAWLVLQCKMRLKSIHMFNMYQLPKTCNHIKTKRKQNSKIKTSVIFMKYNLKNFTVF